MPPAQRQVSTVLDGAHGYLFALLVVAAIAGVGWLLRAYLAEAGTGMVFLLAVVIVAQRASIGPALASAGLSVAVFDFLFVEPLYTFAVREAQYLVTFASMAIVGVTISTLTARVRERERAAREAGLLVESERVRNALLSSISHDVRTPLGSLVGSASALRDQDLDEPNRRELLDTIYEESRHLQRLLDNLLQMTRVTGNALTTSKEWQVPEEVVGAALRRVSDLLDGRRIEVEIEAELGLAQFDGMLIELVLVNLIENSVKYDSSRGPVGLAVREVDAELIWEVTDEGPGLPRGEEVLVFDKFYRGSDRTERGSGLGLAIAKAVVEAHGGRIWGGNRREQRGAVFGFALPINESAPPIPHEELT
ncbi:MAG TPA: DUF4118 domain-containing protein [Kofleriaceae bacterium]|nr:DUF4118 domain-containing protein [Kofleriaceae bacterium]